VVVIGESLYLTPRSLSNMSVRMDGTFNGIRIEKVFAMKISPRTTVLRVLGAPGPDLEDQFTLKSNASIKVSVAQPRSKLASSLPSVLT
jgi:hypothetical protein